MNAPVSREFHEIVAFSRPAQHRGGQRRLAQHLCARAEHEYGRLVFAAVLHEDTQPEQAARGGLVSADDLAAGGSLGRHTLLTFPVSIGVHTLR